MAQTMGTVLVRNGFVGDKASGLRNGVELCGASRAPQLERLWDETPFVMKAYGNINPRTFLVVQDGELISGDLYMSLREVHS